MPKRVREEVLRIRRGAPPTRLIEREKEEERRVGEGLARLFEGFAKLDVPRLMRNVLAIAVGVSTIFIFSNTLGTMLPYAQQIYAQFGRLLGFMIPFMLVYMMFSVMIGVTRLLL